MGMRLILVYFILLALTVTTWAQTSSTSTTTSNKTSAAELLGNKKFQEDKNITDARLKADAGSLSRYSLKFSVFYFGPPVGDLSSKTQPNPDGSVGVFKTSMSGSISGRYRLDSQSAINLGTGISALTPLHGIERFDMKTPFVGYDRMARLGDVQWRGSTGAAVTTIPDFREIGQMGTLKFDNNFIYNIGSSGFAVGVDSGINVYVFERAYEVSDRKATSYSVEVYPSVKYNFTDKLNVSTSLAMRFWNPRSLGNTWALHNKSLTARTGLGWALKRDVYFAPFLSYYPQDFNWKSTTVSFATIFSVL